MRRSILLIAAAVSALTASASPAGAQTVDEIVEKNLKAKGGADKWKSISSVRMSGTFTVQGTTMPMTLHAKRPNLSRQEISVQDRKMIQAFDGTTPWMVNPMTGSDVAQEITGPQGDMARADADFDGALIDYKAKGHVIELVGKEKVGTTDVYHLKLTKKSGNIEHFYLDADSGIEVKRTAEMEAEGKKQSIETELSNFKSIDGILIPHTIKQSLNGAQMAHMTIEKVEFNAPLDDALFRMPKK